MRRRRHRLLRFAEVTFFLAGMVALAFCGSAFLHSKLSQLQAERQFEKLSMPEPGKLSMPEPEKPPVAEPGNEARRFTPEQWRQDANLPIGRLEIPTIGLKVVVLQGTDTWTLNGAVGHISGTAFPGEPGNVGLAGHRDSFFRCLKNIALDDEIILRTPVNTYLYKVDNISIVAPNDTYVLKPSDCPNLTLVTCYPFYFIGNAPQRFVVRARLEGSPEE
jgi:LPXTG-site transpeptidase (sortase) family protein